MSPANKKDLNGQVCQDFALFQTIADSASDAIFAKDEECRYIFVNKAMEMMVGKKVEDIIGKKPAQVFDKKTAITIKEVDDKCLVGKEVSVVRELNLGGKIFYLHTIQKPIYNNKKQIIGVSGIVRDVTSQQEKEKVVEESKKRYQLLFENMMDGFAFHKIIIDKKGKPEDYIFLQANAKFEEYTGLKNEDIIGKRVKEVIPGIEKAKPNLIKLYGRVALGGKPQKIEIFFSPLNKWYSISVYSSEKYFFATIFEDITERKQHAEELDNSKKELERMNKAMVGRELKMKELKKEIDKLKKLK